MKPEKVEKKKTKFVNLYAEDGRDRSILLKGKNRKLILLLWQNFAAYNFFCIYYLLFFVFTIYFFFRLIVIYYWKIVFFVWLTGRNKCDCEAKQHSLINNCLNCGRIVCNQEGAGPCFFCGELVCSPEQQQILAGNSRHADTLYNQLMDKKPKGYEESVKQRNRLLEFDRNRWILVF